tara:strand:- start:50 stop:295 length:246 start_codon:yes stop_codon:yes gene_type:complete
VDLIEKYYFKKLPPDEEMHPPNDDLHGSSCSTTQSMAPAAPVNPAHKDPSAADAACPGPHDHKTKETETEPTNRKTKEQHD